MLRPQHPHGGAGSVSLHPNLTGGGLGTTAGSRAPQTSLVDGLDPVAENLQKIKAAISGLLQYIETQPDSLSWPTIMDRFSTISSQLANLSKIVKSERIPDMRRMDVIPFLVSAETDPGLEKTTEGRIPVMSHDKFPDYFRSKMEPEVEHRFQEAYYKVPPNNAELSQKADKQVQNLNKVVSALVESLSAAKEAWESKTAGLSKIPLTHDVNDTNALLLAMTTGKGLISPPGSSNAYPKYQPGFPGAGGQASQNR
ncbi:hypothetical protein RvY_14351 [Ramazzottius varieornatus]|uniref:Mediator of RNA polymerase II transcription subunit 8 n=1 Tax=Ramazzottius varieornatus TaxID=947166 RepID=A0A1D1VUU9_RAMVA|nr:hypothetical protein RvY_14351 [Ramazzottius varieornatus]